jgi:hypothetical protein
MSKKRWIQWCVKNDIDLSHADFALETCYVGKGFRSRPGTLLVTKQSVIHQSYSWTESVWAYFEPKITVDVPLQTIDSVLKRRLSRKMAFYQLWPEAHYTLRLADRTEVDLILQRDSGAFESVLANHGFNVTAA